MIISKFTIQVGLFPGLLAALELKFFFCRSPVVETMHL